MVADLERPQHLQEYSGREVGQQAAPGRADRQAGSSQQRGEGGGPDAEDVQDRQHQQHIERDADDSGNVDGQCGIEPVAAQQRGAGQTLQDADHPAADEPGHYRAQRLQAEIDSLGAEESPDHVRVHRLSPC